MRDATPDRLLALRRRGEKQALETLILRAGMSRRATVKADELVNAVAGRAKKRRALERALFEDLVGRPVSQTAIMDLRDRLAAMAAEEARLREAIETAQGTVREYKDVLDAAHSNFCQRQRVVAKLDLVFKRRQTRSVRRLAALADADAEEWGNSHVSQPVMNNMEIGKP
jgi:hypothetical protein